MEIQNSHHRLVIASSDRIADLLADLDRVWPTQLAPAPRLRANGLYDAGPMLWQETEPPRTVRAFRVVKPSGLQAEHAFELEPLGAGTVVRHTVRGRAVGEWEALWRDRIEPLHDLILEALLDNLEAAVESDDA